MYAASGPTAALIDFELKDFSYELLRKRCCPYIQSSFHSSCNLLPGLLKKNMDKGIEIQCMKFRLGQFLVCQYLFVNIPLIKDIKKD